MTVYITRCPACQQAFKITENILQAKNGQVRCGFCQNVFNAREHLYKSIDLEGSLNRIEREAEVERQGIANMKSLADQLKGFDSVDDNQGLVGVRTEPRNGPERLDIINGPSIEVISHPAPNQNLSDDESEDEDSEIQEESTKPRSSKTWLWAIIALVAIIAIALKVLASNQNAVLDKIPQAEPLFGLLCDKITCEPRRTVTPLDAPIKSETTKATPSNPTTSVVNQPVAVLSHKLQQIEGNRYAISVELKNNTDSAQTYPILTVVLKGEKEDIITRRRIAPQEYLSDAKQSIAAQATETVTLAFDMTDGDPATLSVEIDSIS